MTTGSRRVRRVVAALLVTAASVLGAVAPVGAHTEVDESAPAPGQDVGGTVDWIEIRFLSPVQDAVILLEDPHGHRIDGTTELLDPTTVRFEMTPLDHPGEHIVTWRVMAADGDGQESAYAFTYDPAAPPLDDGGSNVPGWATALILVGIVAACGAGFLALMRRTTGRRRTGRPA